MPTHDFEILSPAGSLETLKCAVNNGADAVYIGGRSFSARKNAVNFSNEDITDAVRYAHLCDSKVYVTVNTLVGDTELNEVYKFISFLYEAGVDALIIQDLGILSMVRRYFPDFELHASTQMTIHNLKGARLAKSLGFKRVVLSRELTFDEIEHISRNVDIELEVFVHGALCMSYSGQCLMSSFLGSRSGNRGACAQPCRLPYTLMSSDGRMISDKDKYLLSLRDLCLVERMDDLARCNVRSLKIEGRMKSADYVSLVTRIYDKYRHGGKVSSEDMDSLANIFSRSGFTQGYLDGSLGRHMLNYHTNNDKVYDNISRRVGELAKECRNSEPPKILFDAQADLSMREPMKLTLSAKGVSVTVQGTVPAEKAINLPLSEERIIKQIAKTGQTLFKPGEISVRVEDGVSLPVREINELRRLATELLEDKICAVDRKAPEGEFRLDIAPGDLYSPTELNAEVRNISQAKAAIEAGFDKLLVPYALYAEERDWFESLSAKLAVVLPPIVRDNRPIDTSILPEEIYASNISQLVLCKDKRVNANFQLNVYNSLSLKFMSEMGLDTVCLSPEMNLRAIFSMSSSAKKEIIVYGRIPLMTVQNCVVRSSKNKCSCVKDGYLLRDRKGVRFPLFTDKTSCTNTIYNAAPIYMADRMNEIDMKAVSALRFIFTTETPEEIKDIKKRFKHREKADFDFTRGHYYRGV